MAVFKATDGTTFTSRAAWRKYEFESQYAFRSKKNQNLLKPPGAIHGQPFDLSDLETCEVCLVDTCDQVQCDNLKRCKIFIGACSESVFLRNCVDCLIYTACKQLRTRDCVNCTISLYCKTEPIIETSKDIRFAPFRGAYACHREHMKSACLNIQNMWHAVFDFNDHLKTGENWKHISREEVPIWNPLNDGHEVTVPYTESFQSTQSLQNVLSDVLHGLESGSTLPFISFSNAALINSAPLPPEPRGSKSNKVSACICTDSPDSIHNQHTLPDSEADTNVAAVTNESSLSEQVTKFKQNFPVQQLDREINLSLSENCVVKKGEPDVALTQMHVAMTDSFVQERKLVSDSKCIDAEGENRRFDLFLLESGATHNTSDDVKDDRETADTFCSIAVDADPCCDESGTESFSEANSPDIYKDERYQLTGFTSDEGEPMEDSDRNFPQDGVPIVETQQLGNGHENDINVPAEIFCCSIKSASSTDGGERNYEPENNMENLQEILICQHQLPGAVASISLPNEAKESNQREESTMIQCASLQECVSALPLEADVISAVDFESDASSQDSSILDSFIEGSMNSEECASEQQSATETDNGSCFSTHISRTVTEECQNASPPETRSKSAHMDSANEGSELKYIQMQKCETTAAKDVELHLSKSSQHTGDPMELDIRDKRSEGKKVRTVENVRRVIDLDLNKVSEEELRIAKEEMEREFVQRRISHDDPSFVFDRRIDFEAAVENCKWDEESDDEKKEEWGDSEDCFKDMHLYIL